MRQAVGRYLKCQSPSPNLTRHCKAYLTSPMVCTSAGDQGPIKPLCISMATAGDQYNVTTGNIWNHANRGDTVLVQAALDSGVDVNLQNKAGWTALHAAAHGGQVRLRDRMISSGHCNGVVTHTSCLTTSLSIR